MKEREKGKKGGERKEKEEREGTENTSPPGNKCLVTALEETKRNLSSTSVGISDVDADRPVGKHWDGLGAEVDDGDDD